MAILNQVRWGMVGVGRVTEVKSGPALQLAKNSALYGIYARNLLIAEDYARRHSVERVFCSLEDLLDSPHIDAVYIATPPGSHRELALLACRAGRPTYVEKPMARSYRECEEMNLMFQSARVPLYVAYYRRALPRFQLFGQLAMDGTIGDVSRITYRASKNANVNCAPLPRRLQAEQSGGGLFLDVGCHVLDALDHLFGAIQDVRGLARKQSNDYDVEEYVSMDFRIGGRVSGHAVWNFCASFEEDVLEVEGSNGSVRMNVFSYSPILVSLKDGSSTQYRVPDPKHIQQPLVQTIVDELLGCGTCPSTGVSAARTSAVIDCVLSDYYGGRSDDFWARPSTWPGLSSPSL